MYRKTQSAFINRLTAFQKAELVRKRNLGRARYIASQTRKAK